MRFPHWKIDITMKLGKEKSKFSSDVSLGDDVRTVLMNMREARENAISAINEAYESILVSAAKEMAARKTKNSRK